MAASASLRASSFNFRNCSARASLIFSHAFRIDSLCLHAEALFEVLFVPVISPGAQLDALTTPRYSGSVSRDVESARARLRPSRHRHSARTEARPPGMSQRSPREV